MASLTTVSNMPGEVEFQGVMYPHVATKQTLESMSSWPVHDGDIFIAGYPKVGNNWVQTIVSAIFVADNLDEFEKDGPQNMLRYPFELFSLPYIQEKISRPNIFYTHLYPFCFPTEIKEKKNKVIYVLRNPNDVAVSFYHFHRMQKILGCYKGTWDDFFPYFNSGNVVFGSYYKHTQEWLRNLNDFNGQLMIYEEMSSDPVKAIETITTYLEKPLSDNQIERIAKINSFEDMRRNPALNKEGLPQIKADISPLLRKGQVGDWKNYFNEQQTKEAEEKYQDLVEKTGISLRYE